MPRYALIINIHRIHARRCFYFTSELKFSAFCFPCCIGFYVFKISGPSNVSVSGNLNVIEGGNISLKCEHQLSFPPSNGSLFFFDGASTYIEEVKKWCKTFNLSLALNFLLENSIYVLVFSIALFEK